MLIILGTLECFSEKQASGVPMPNELLSGRKALATLWEMRVHAFIADAHVTTSIGEAIKKEKRVSFYLSKSHSCAGASSSPSVK